MTAVAVLDPSDHRPLMAALDGELVILSLNDGPLGVYSTPGRAAEAAEQDWKRREPRWEALGLKLGESLHNGIKYSRYYYHTTNRRLDGPPRL